VVLVIWTAWWAWMLMAVVLAILEVVLPTFILLGFAIGAGLVGLGLLMGVLGPAVSLAGGTGLALLVVLFASLSLVAWILLRRVFGRVGDSPPVFDDDIND
jgi:membrane protein implicated in regulation of membrane protease activity